MSDRDRIIKVLADAHTALNPMHYLGMSTLRAYADALIEAGARIPDQPTGCGGCRGLGAHRPTCITQPGWLWRKAARMAEGLGDLIGAHDTELANRAYQLSADLKRRFNDQRP